MEQDAKQQESEQAIRIDFSGYPGLLERIQRRANEQLRDLQSQILWELTTYSFEPALVEKELARKIFKMEEEGRD